MDTELFNLLAGNGALGLTGALFFYLWQRSEAEKKEMRKELYDMRDAYEIKFEGHTKTLLELQEKRLGDAGKFENVVAANTASMTSTNNLLQTLLGPSHRGGRQ